MNNLNSLITSNHNRNLMDIHPTTPTTLQTTAILKHLPTWFMCKTPTINNNNRLHKIKEVEMALRLAWTAV